ncbi:MAG: sterol desaturase family protein [Deltaproteobacteria bacterium]|nr:sterol desaturase family protein [Deltaproteobacteria bacterium]
MTELYVWMGVSLAVSGVLVVALAWMHHAPRFADHRIRKGMPMRMSIPHRVTMGVITSVLSLAITLGTPWLLRDVFFTETMPAWWVMVLQGIGIVLVYDFTYYFLHRLMHVKALMPLVHHQHHRAVNPSSLEAFYQHPAELVAGLTLLFFALWAVGPVHTRVFGVVFFFYSTVNILVHSGMQFRTPLLAPIDYLTRKHHAHHLQDGRKNYATLTPFWDLMFGTAL